MLGCRHFVPLLEIIGYADGINDGRESVFQKGFDEGYIDGLTTGFDLEKFRVFFNHLNTNKTTNVDLVKEKEEFGRLLVKDLKSLQLKNKNLNLFSQQDVEETITKFAKKIPVATNLLSVQPNTAKLL